MIVRIIAAMSDDGVVALDDGSLPWRMASDLKHFRTLTENCSLIVGRRTFDLLPRAMIDQGGRQFFVLSKGPFQQPCFTHPEVFTPAERFSIFHQYVSGGDDRWSLPNVHTASSIDQAIGLMARQRQQKVWLIGGPGLWNSTIDYAEAVVLSRIHTTLGHGVQWTPAPIGGFENSESPRPAPDLEQAGFHLTKVESRVRGPGDDHEWSVEHWRRGH